MSRVWHKEKICYPDRNRIYDLPNTGQTLYPLSYGEIRGEQGHIYSHILIYIVTLRISVDRAPARCLGGH